MKGTGSTAGTGGLIPYRNIVANYAGKLWIFLTSYALSPFFIRLLGTEQYGLVGFYNTMLGILSIADFGLTPTLYRDVSIFAVAEDGYHRVGCLIKTYRRIYSVLCICISILVLVLSPLLGEYWFDSQQVPRSTIILALSLSGIAIALQMYANLFFTILLGLQHQVWANVLQILWGTLKGFGGILVLSINGSIIHFFLWQIISNGLYLGAIALFIQFRICPASATFKFDAGYLRASKAYIIGITVNGVFSTLILQADKLFVSKYFSLEAFGYYSVASMIAQLTSIIANPIATAFFPKLNNCYSLNDHHGLELNYRKLFKITSSIVLFSGTALCFNLEDVLRIWIEDPSAISNISGTLLFLLVGWILQSMTIPQYYVSLAYGKTKFNTFLGLFSLVVYIPLLFICHKVFGILGLGIAWSLVNVLTYLPYTVHIHRDYFHRLSYYIGIAFQNFAVALLSSLFISNVLGWLPLIVRIGLSVAVGAAMLTLSLGSEKRD